MGNLVSAAVQAFPPKPTWSVDDIPDLSGKVCLVTGASFVAFRQGETDVDDVTRLMVAWSEGGNAGIGKETVKVRLFASQTLHPRSQT